MAWLWRLVVVFYLVFAAVAASVAIQIARFFGLGAIDLFIGIGVFVGLGVIGEKILK